MRDRICEVDLGLIGDHVAGEFDRKRASACMANLGGDVWRGKFDVFRGRQSGGVLIEIECALALISYLLLS